MTFIIILFIAYILGSIPFGFLISRFWLGMDIREHGSGNIGMTNVIRVAGKLPGILTFILDFLKGSVAVIIGIIWLSGTTENPTDESFLVIQLACIGVTAVLGHVFSLFLKFKGGKGISTTFGILVVLDFYIGLVAGLIWVGMFLAKNISSLAALAMLASLPFLTILIPWIAGNEIYFSKVVIYGGLSLLLLYRHRENIARLRQGREDHLHAAQNK